MISSDDMENRAGVWIDALNSHDLERILRLYADQCEMTSPHIVALGLDASGTVMGKDRLRGYWGSALTRQPDLRFELISVFANPNSVVIRYRNERGQEVCEYLRFDADGLIVQGAAHHAAGGV